MGLRVGWNGLGVFGCGRGSGGDRVKGIGDKGGDLGDIRYGRGMRSYVKERVG